jgi:hypothetical protein
MCSKRQNKYKLNNYKNEHKTCIKPFPVGN